MLPSFNFLRCCEMAGMLILRISLMSQGHSSPSSSNRYRIFNLTSLEARSRTLVRLRREGETIFSLDRHCFICASSAKTLIQLNFSIWPKVKIFPYLSKYLNTEAWSNTSGKPQRSSQLSICNAFNDRITKNN